MTIFHRVSTGTQTLQTAVLQVHDAEVWGAAPQNSELRCVQAYFGVLPYNRNGIEFETAIEPTPHCSTREEAYWYFGYTPEVVEVPGSSEYVKIPVVIREVVYRNSDPLLDVSCIFRK